MDIQELCNKDKHMWSGNDCIDVVLIWLLLHRDKLDDAIAKIEAARPPQRPATVMPSQNEPNDAPGVPVADSAPKRALYFGCRGAREAGHYLQEGRQTIWDVPPECYWSLGLMDSGLLKNGRHRDIDDGRVFWTCGGRDDLWYAFVWWDNSGDSRPGSNSGFYVRGFAPEVLTPETARENAAPAFQFACEQYPWVIERQRVPLVLQMKEPR